MTLTASTGIASSPYSASGDLTWSNDITMTGDLTVEGDFTFGNASTDTLTVNGLLKLNANDGAAAANALLMGIGTSADPATTATANKSFMEFRCESTATSGDSRALYIRFALNGAGVSGESIRSFSKVTAAATNVRGAHISLDVGTGGSVSGLGVGVDSQIMVLDAALTGGTYTVGNFEIYSNGSSTDVGAVTELSFLRCIAGGNATGAATVDDKVFFASFSGVAAGSGNMIDTDIATHTAYAGLRINVAGTTKYLAVVSD